MIKRQELENKVSGLEKEISEFERDRKALIYRIFELEKKLSDKPKRVDTRDEAFAKATEFNNETVASRMFEFDCYFEVVWIDELAYRNTEIFKFKKPREPQPGDIMVNETSETLDTKTPL